MIVGIGSDSVDIGRFCPWACFSNQQLTKVFSMTEIMYCKEFDILAPQRFAVRFAAREAFFKALCSSDQLPYNPFLRVCKSVCITHQSNGAPRLCVEWQKLHIGGSFKVHVSLTHCLERALAFVIIERDCL